VTTADEQRLERVIAVYDVRDLCRNTKETLALINAIPGQTSGEWHSKTKTTTHGRVVTPKSGCIIVRHTQKTHRELLQLLQKYRRTLANSKQRRAPDSSDQVVTRFFRLQTPLAKALQQRLEQLVAGWDSDSKTDRIAVGKGVTSETNDDGEMVPFELELSVLIVIHKRSVQRELNNIIDRLTNGDHLIDFDQEGRGGGGGGFGGGGHGFFSLRDLTR
jgi:type II secretory pathway component GspD/PulD (secretin)